jgi:hypothetical protein
MPTLEKGGEWWLPEHPEHKVPGLARIDEREGTSLMLLGELRSRGDRGVRVPRDDGLTELHFTEESMEVAARYPRLLGQVGSKAVTLVDGFMRQHEQNLMGGITTEVIGFNQALVGMWVPAKEEIVFDRVSVSIQWLAEWVSESHMTETHRPDGDAFAVEVDQAPSRHVRLGDSRTVWLHHGIHLTGDLRNQRTVGQLYRFETRHSQLLPLLDLMRFPNRLRDLVSIATGRSCGYESVTLTHPRVVRRGTHRGRRPQRLPVEFYARWSAHDYQEAAPSLHDMLFTLPDLGGLPGLGRWMRVAERYQHQLDVVMATRIHMGIVSDHLLNRVAALESFHRVRSGHVRPALRTSLLACADLAGEPFARLVGDVERWVMAIKAQRHDIAHGSDGGYETEPMLYFADTAYWLFVVCLLREMKAPKTVFRHIVETSDFRFLQRKFAALCGA